jgi:hypothetical protein
VPAVHERRTPRHTSGEIISTLDNLTVREDPIDQAGRVSPIRCDQVSSQKDLQHGPGSEQLHQRLQLIVRHGETEPVDGRTKAAGLLTDPEVAANRDLQSPAHTQPLDDRERRVRALAHSAHRFAYRSGVGAHA